MNTAIKIPLQSLNPVLVKDLQEKYPTAMVSIEAETPAEGAVMDEQQFWDIITQLDWGRKRSEDITDPAVEALSQFSEQDIFRFEQILAEKLYAIDGEAYAKPLGWGSSDGQHFSVDVFLYARCCAVANGKAFYEKVLKNPVLMPKELTFEPLLYLAEKAHCLKTGSDHYDFLPTVSYETFSNQAGWKGIPPLSQVIKGKAG
jgi:uncharacterized protein DUF4240